MKSKYLLFLVSLAYSSNNDSVLNPVFAEADEHADATSTKNPKIGLAMVGGSFRAAVVNAGIMKGFQRKMVMINGEEKPGMQVFHQIAALSGGNVPNFLYHFAPASTDELLDTDGNIDPSEITIEDLDTIPPNSMLRVMTTTLLEPLLLSILLLLLLQIPMIETIIGALLLEPMGIDPTMPAQDLRVRDEVSSTPFMMTTMVGPSELYPEWNLEHRSTMFIDLLNKHGRDNLDPFPPMPDLPPFYTSNMTYMMELMEKSTHQVPIPGYLSDEKLNVLYHPSTMKFDPVGNKTVPDLEYAPVTTSYSSLSTESNPLSASKVLAMALDLTGIVVEERDFSGPMAPVNDLLSNGLYVDIPTATGETRSMAFSDGGYNDATGLPALLKEGEVDKIVITFVERGYPNAATPEEVLFQELFSYMGVFAFPIERNFLELHSMTNYMLEPTVEAVEKVFADINALHEAGEPTIVTMKDVEVVDNLFWGITGDRKVDITFIVISEVPKKFAEQVPADVVPPPTNKPIFENGYFTNEEFAEVPRISSSRPLEIPIANIDVPGIQFAVPPRVANMAHILSTWSIDRAWNGLKDVNGTTRFEGFPNFFGDEIGESTSGFSESSTTEDTVSSSGFSVSSTTEDTAPSSMGDIVSSTTENTIKSTTKVEKSKASKESKATSKKSKRSKR